MKNIFLFLFTLFAFNLVAQIEIDESNLEADGIKITDQINIIESIRQNLELYVEKAKLYDDGEGAMNEVAKQEFGNLFNDIDVTKVFDDLDKKGLDGLSVRDYMDKATRNFKDGIAFNLVSSSVKAMKIYDESTADKSEFRVIVQLEKRMFSTIDGNEAKLLENKPRIIPMKFTFTTELGDYPYSRIDKITLNAKQKVQSANTKKSMSLLVYGRYGIAPIITANKSERVSSDMEIDGYYSLSGGVDLYLPIGGTGKTNLILGMGYAQHQFTSSIASGQSLDFRGDGSQIMIGTEPVLFDFSFNDTYSEDYTVNKVEAHLGLSRKIAEIPNRWEFLVEGILIPEFTFSDATSYTQNYNAEEQGGNPVICNIATAGNFSQFADGLNDRADWDALVGTFGAPNPNSSLKDGESNINLSARLGATYYHIMGTSKFYYFIGVDGTWNITNFFNIRDESSINSADDLNNPEWGLSQFALKDLNFLNLGARVGLRFYFKR